MSIPSRIRLFVVSRDPVSPKMAASFSDGKLPFVHEVNCLVSDNQDEFTKKLADGISEEDRIILAVVPSDAAERGLLDEFFRDLPEILVDVWNKRRIDWDKDAFVSLFEHFLSSRSFRSLLTLALTVASWGHNSILLSNSDDQLSNEPTLQSEPKLAAMLGNTLDIDGVRILQIPFGEVNSIENHLVNAIFSQISPILLGTARRHHLKPQSEYADAPWGKMSSANLEHLLKDLIEEEFENEASIDQFERLLPNETNDVAGDKSNQRRLSVLIAIVFARFLAKASVEGVDFESNIVLLDEQIHGLVANNGKQDSRIYSYSKSNKLGKVTFFHFSDPRFCSVDFELLLSSDLTLFVNSDSLRCLEVRQVTLQQYWQDLSSLVSVGGDRNVNRSISISIRPKGYVEVYRGEQLVLWYDRFRWRALPYQKLTKRLSAFFGQQKKTPRIIQEAVSILLDRQLSAIIAFVPDDDLENVFNGQEVKLEPIISDLVRKIDTSKEAAKRNQSQSEQRLNIDSISLLTIAPETMVALARLDGAMILSRDKVVAVSHRIDKQRAKKTRSELHAGHLLGTGGQAAELLAKHISPPGFVVKVSASGDLLVLDRNNTAG